MSDATNNRFYREKQGDLSSKERVSELISYWESCDPGDETFIREDILRDTIALLKSESVPCPRSSLAEPPPAWQPIETAPTLGKWVLLWWPDVTDAAFVGYCIDGQWRAATSGDRWPTLPGPTHWMPLPSPPVTKDAGECGACDKPGEHCANVHGICSRHGGRAHETKGGQS